MPMADDFEYVSKTRLVYRNGARHAYLGDVPEPVVYGVQGALRQYYRAPAGPPVAPTLDHILAGEVEGGIRVQRALDGVLQRAALGKRRAEREHRGRQRASYDVAVPPPDLEPHAAGVEIHRGRGVDASLVGVPHGVHGPARRQ